MLPIVRDRGTPITSMACKLLDGERATADVLGTAKRCAKHAECERAQLLLDGEKGTISSRSWFATR